MRSLLFTLLALAGAVMPLPARAQSAPAIHVNVDAGDQSDHATRLADDLAAARLSVSKPLDSVDPNLMPFVSQVRYYFDADKAVAERALEVLQRYRTRAVLVPGEGGGAPGRIDVFVSLQDDDGSGISLQPAYSEPRPEWPASITDETLRLVFDPEDTSKDPLKGAPPTARAFLAAAKKADAITDDVQRCLAYPDLPGSQWSPALVRAMCGFGNAPVLSVADVRDHVARNDVAGLEAKLSASLARHFEDGPRRSELIHRELGQFSDAADAGGTIASWRQQAPESAFALAAEASYLTGAAWRARGDDFDVSPQQFAQMRALAAQATAAAQAAVRIDPKLMPAWASLIELAQLTGDQDLAASAYRSASDAGSYGVALARMNSLRPRWGGSVGAMDAFAGTLAAQVAERPMLALVMAMPDGERGFVAGEERDYKEMARVLLPRVVQVPEPGSLLTLGNAYATFVPDGRFAGLAYLLEAARFGECLACARNSLAQNLMGLAGDREWALVHLQRQVRQHPGDLDARQLIGMVHFQQERHAEAIEVLKGVLAEQDDKRKRHDALDLLIAASKAAGKSAQAAEYERQQQREDAQ